MTHLDSHYPFSEFPEYRAPGFGAAPAVNWTVKTIARRLPVNARTNRPSMGERVRRIGRRSRRVPA